MQPSPRLVGEVMSVAMLAYLSLACFVDARPPCLVALVVVAYVVGNFACIGVHI